MPAIVVMFGAREAGLQVAIPVIIAIIALSFFAIGLGWWRTYYRIGASDIRLNTGVLSRSARSVPFERIQDVSLEQGLVARFFGLVEVRFETGAGGNDILTLAYVTQNQGETLRDIVRERGDEARRDAGADVVQTGAPAMVNRPRAMPTEQHFDNDTAVPLFSMGPRRILLFGLFEFSLVAFVVLAGAAQQFDFLLPFDIWELAAWEERLAGPMAQGGQWLERFGWFARVIGVFAALTILAAVGLATGLARTIAREYDFCLERTAKGFRRRRGLFTRTDVVMPVHRVQALIFTTGLVRKLWGWHRLAFISLARDAGSAHHTVAPFATMAEIAPIAAAAGFVLPDLWTDWHRPCARYRLDRVVLAAFFPLAAALVVLVLGRPFESLALLAVAALFAMGGYVSGRHRWHAFDARQLLVRHAWLAPQTKIAMRVKLHSVEITQGPIARRRGYGDLQLGLAGSQLKLRGIALSEAQGLRDAVLTSISAVGLSQLPQ